MTAQLVWLLTKGGSCHRRAALLLHLEKYLEGPAVNLPGLFLIFVFFCFFGVAQKLEQRNMLSKHIRLKAQLNIHHCTDTLSGLVVHFGFGSRVCPGMALLDRT